MLIATGRLKPDALYNKTTIVTGGGRGIGFETARSLLWLGARVVIAEINAQAGRDAAGRLEKEFGKNRVLFVRCDVGHETDINRLKKIIHTQFGTVDIIINNATRVFVDPVEKIPISVWDSSYRTNLRGPLLLTLAFLPDMIAKNEGVLVFVSSSGAVPYLGAYEVFKTAQVELGHTLAAELQNTNIHAFTIGPGISKTPGLSENLDRLAVLYKKTPQEFIDMSRSVLISAEAAGAGFAASAAMAARYRETETSSFQALRDAGIGLEDVSGNKTIPAETKANLLGRVRKVVATFVTQYEGWHKRSVFERQWILRDFKKQTSNPPEHYLSLLKALEASIEQGEIQAELRAFDIKVLADYWRHQMVLLKGFEKNPQKLAEYSAEMQTWIDEIEECAKLLAAV